MAKFTEKMYTIMLMVMRLFPVHPEKDSMQNNRLTALKALERLKEAK